MPPALAPDPTPLSPVAKSRLRRLGPASAIRPMAEKAENEMEGGGQRIPSVLDKLNLAAVVAEAMTVPEHLKNSGSGTALDDDAKRLHTEWSR